MTERRPAKAVILAAGLGTRMRSSKPKVLHEVLGQPMVNWVVEKALTVNCEEIAVVVGHAKEDVIETINRRFSDDRITFYEQTQMLGTGDAVRAAQPCFGGFDGNVLILCGDVPNVPVTLMEDLLQRTRGPQTPVSLISAIAPPGTHYGRIVRNAENAVDAIVEYKDAGDEVRDIREINTGNYAVDSAFLLDGLARLNTDNAQGEFYLTDLIAMAANAGSPAEAIVAENIDQLDGVNTRANLGHANEVALAIIRERWMNGGVTMLQPSSVWLDTDVKLEADVSLEPHVTLLGSTHVESGAYIESFCRLLNCRVAAGVRVAANTVAADRTFSSR